MRAALSGFFKESQPRGQSPSLGSYSVAAAEEAAKARQGRICCARVRPHHRSDRALASKQHRDRQAGRGLLFCAIFHLDEPGKFQAAIPAMRAGRSIGFGLDAGKRIPIWDYLWGRRSVALFDPWATNPELCA